MSVATNNRAKRRRNAAANERGLKRYWASRVDLKGNARPYYQAQELWFDRRRGRIVGVRYKIRPTKLYRDTMQQLMEMAKGVTVDLSSILHPDNPTAPAPPGEE